MAQCLTYCHRLSYNTASNITSLSQTPGNRIIYLFTKKVGKVPKSACGMCAVRSKVFTKLSKMKKHVSRAYGGSMSAKCVSENIKCTFLKSRKSL
ncbi:unnamed protein product [Nyctereutes procyonoides]|uniref:Large ribosomal subunit protein eL34 n=1 Tax=Nyctereutes procyonoides TaxID=34880 RepID=A0A811ZGK0_NYCPR|nr:unnamed protein product [Nyctereutes procyonoides]